MKVLVVGGAGMLGSDVCAELTKRELEFSAPDLDQLNITDPMHTAEIAAGKYRGFDWCINCAAYTAVDKAETEVREATEVNVLGVGYLAQACALAGTKLLHISTDFVFDGEASEPYSEEASTNPLGVYARTKLEGEREALGANNLVVRTAWLYGPNGASFPRTMIRAWKEGKSLRVVSDQTGCPTYTGDLARVLVDLIQMNAFPGIYHAVGPESMTWHEFALRAIRADLRREGRKEEVVIEAIKTENWPTPAKRPKYSVLSTAKIRALGIQPMRPVDEALDEFVERLA